MKYSKIFGKTSKTTQSDADSLNAKLLTQAGFVTKQMSGVYNYLPLGLRVLTKIQNIIHEEMEKLGAQEILMPALSQEENWVTTGRQDMDVLFHLNGQEDAKYVLNPTHEEVVTPLVQKFIFSYRDLPLAVYQIQNKFRNEARAKSGLMRGREFNMKDMYSFHTNEEDLNDFYDKAISAYTNIYKRLGLGDTTVLTYASGGSFSKFSHEFQTINDAGEDTIYLCEKCNVAINREIIDVQTTCPKCSNSNLKTVKATEVGNIFKLVDKFSSAFDFRFTNDKGEKETVKMGCYGIGPSRIMGTIAEIFNDEKGLIWSDSITPYKVHLIGLDLSDESIKSQVESLYKQLLDKNIEVLFDDRDISPGAKFADADLIGIPLRVIVGKRSLAGGGAEIKYRNQSESKIINLDQVIEICN